MDALAGVPDPKVRRTRRYHSHTSGLLYIGFTLLLAVGAINSQNNLLFLALGLSIGGLLVSGVLSGASLMGVRVERNVAGRAAVGKPLRIRYRVANANRLVSAFGLHIVEAAGARGLMRGDRSRRQVPWPRFFSQPRTFVVHVPPSCAVEAEVIVTPGARGAIDLTGVQVWSTFPFGLTKKSVNFGLHRTILVLPPELPLRSGVLRRLTMRSSHGAGGESTAGQGDEFFGLREYVAGDSLRQIAWKRTARTGQLVVRQNAAPSPPRMWVMLNFSASAARGEDGGAGAAQAGLDERAIALASSILRAASGDGTAVGLTVPAARLHHPPREGHTHLDRLLTDLALLQPEAIRNGDSAAPAAINRGGATAACIVIHAGDVDQALGAPGAHHIAAAAAEEYLAADDASVASVLAILDRPVDGGRARGGLVSRLILRVVGVVPVRGWRS